MHCPFKCDILHRSELLNVFYFREILFIVYELLRDNLYHM